MAGLVEIGSYRPATDETPASDEAGALAWLMDDMNAAISTARDDDLLIYVHGAKVNFYNAGAETFSGTRQISLKLLPLPGV